MRPAGTGAALAAAISRPVGCDQSPSMRGALSQLAVDTMTESVVAIVSAAAGHTLLFVVCIGFTPICPV